MPSTTVLAGLPAHNATLFHRIRFSPPDACAMIDFADGRSIFLVRDLEMDRARKQVRADRIGCAADFAPAGGLSGDRDTALAQAAAECVRQSGETTVTVDRTLPYLYAHHLREAGIEVRYSPDLGVRERRIKTAAEIEHLRHAQAITGEAVTFACRLIARATPDRDGALRHDGAVLTSERVRALITGFLLDRGFSNPHDSIVVTVPHIADCHHFGTGPLRVNEAVIVDIFPLDNATRYCGDMTRTVVCGEPSDEVRRMHRAVCEAKAAGCAALRAGATGEAVHLATTAVIEQHGFGLLRGDARRDSPVPTMRHGTGHGIGLEVHEPILLDHGGGAIHAGEVFTVEPGLYSETLGGVRVEDMVLATDDGHEILSPLHEGLEWID
jgi:Xaa-Pro aminopeptidase